MWRQIKLLSSVQLLNVFGINEARYSRDVKKKRRLILMAGLYAFVILLMGFYIGGLAYGFVAIGAGNIIPLYLALVNTMVILFFTIYWAGPVVFNLKTYDNTIVLPVSPTAIVISRLLTVYLFNTGLSLLVLVPGVIVSGIYLKPGLVFYLTMVLGAFILPLIPMTIAMILGALIYGLSSRMKHKNVAIILFSFIVVFAFFLLPFLIPQGEGVTEQDIIKMISGAITQAGSMYPPALWFAQGVVEANWGSLLIFVGGSLIFFGVIALLIGWKFKAICTALGSHAAKRNYVMETQIRRSVLGALYRRELRRYFASSIYVINTSIGYLLSVLMAGGITFIGMEVILNEVPLPPGMELSFIPLIMAMLGAISPTTANAISIEGKHWWITQTLPVEAESVYLSKLLVNLTIALPCYALSTILLIIGLKPTGLQLLCFIFLPLVYHFFTAVLGLVINIKMPMFHWESETTVVKQSKSTIFTMLLGFASGIIPILAIQKVPVQWHSLFLLGLTAVVALLTVILYQWTRRIRLNQIG
jgi:ABC-2 type transport system permease protein